MQRFGYELKIYKEINLFETLQNIKSSNLKMLMIKINFLFHSLSYLSDLQEARKKGIDIAGLIKERRRGESNPRPRALSHWYYMHSL